MIDIANPSEEHQMLREMIRDFVDEFVEPQAHEYDKKEQFNIELFRDLGELGLLGITVPEEKFVEGFRRGNKLFKVLQPAFLI